MHAGTPCTDRASGAGNEELCDGGCKMAAPSSVGLGTWDSLRRDTTTSFRFFRSSPWHLRGSIEFGVVTQSAMVFAQLLGAISLVVVQFGSMSEFAAVTPRLGSLVEEMETVPPQTTRGRMMSRAFRRPHGRDAMACRLHIRR
jgi:ABC-type uncharacterized transport system fused permease/ATPase subunit